MPARFPLAHRVAAVTAAVVLSLGLAACAEQPPTDEPIVESPAAPDPDETSEPVPEPEPEPEPEPDPVFAMPEDCTMILPADRVQSLLGQNLALLGGPGSLYGEEFFVDETPEELVGGISCVWAQEDVPASSLLLSVAPLNAATRAQTVNDLIAQGYLEQDREDSSLALGVIGDSGGAPAIYNLITDDAWFSVISALGGETGFDEAILLAEELRGVAYGLME